MARLSASPLLPGRGLTSDDVDKAPQGGWWWWNGLPQYW